MGFLSRIILISSSLVFLLSGMLFTGCESGSKRSGEAGQGERGIPVDQVVIVYYFHVTERCETCLAMEQYTRLAAQTFPGTESVAVKFRSVNTDLPEYMHYAESFDLYGSTVILGQESQPQESLWQNCENIWDYYDDESAYVIYLHTAINQYLKNL